MAANDYSCDAGSLPQASDLTGRGSDPLPPDWWPDHDRSPRTDFVNERNRTALMWKL